jgi:hypothetical protein
MTNSSPRIRGSIARQPVPLIAALHEDEDRSLWKQYAFSCTIALSPYSARFEDHRMTGQQSISGSMLLYERPQPLAYLLDNFDELLRQQRGGG